MQATSLPLPVADSIKTASVHDRLSRFAECVRAVDYAAARPFWHSDIVVFGTYQELVRGLTAWTDTQWDNVWPRTDGFAFDLNNTAVLASADGTMATAVAPWTSTGFHADGTPFERPGRATIVLMCQPDGRWLGVHSHMSLQRGVPQDSHGDRPVKVRQVVVARPGSRQTSSTVCFGGRSATTGGRLPALTRFDRVAAE